MTISFDIPADAQQLMADIRDWSLNEVRPLARLADTEQTKYVEGWKDAVATCPLDVSPLSVPEFGLSDRRTGKTFTASQSEEGSHVLGVLAMEAMCYGDGFAWGLLPRNANLEKILSVIGTPEQVEFFEQDENAISSFAFTEEGCGSDITAIKTQAVRDGDEWVINGTKRFSSQGAEASMMLVFLTVDPALGMRGLRGMMIPADTPGIEILRETEDMKLGMRYLRQSTVRFTDVRVPLNHMLGRDPNDASSFLEGLNVLNRTRPYCMAWNVGTLRGAADYVRDWATENRTSFNPQRWRLIDGELADMHAQMDDLMRIIVNASWRADVGKPHRTEAAMAKSAGPRVIDRAYRRLLQIMGSDSSSEAHLLERWYRDALTFDLLEGTSQILKLTVSRGVFAQAARESGDDAIKALQPVAA